MKSTTLNPLTGVSRHSSIKHVILLKTVFIALIIGLGIGCSPEATDEVEEQEENNIHVAFAGGGWRAHTGHAAWIMSLLESNDSTSGCALAGTSGNPQCLEAAFANVKTISGNSGGSWFSTMLMYDSSFVNAITNVDAVQNWGSTDSGNPNQGWLGKQQTYWTSFTECSSEHKADYLECVLKKYFNTSVFPDPLPTPSWSVFVENLVYKGYDWQSYGNLNSNTRQAWAKDKSLLMAGTWLTNAVVLNKKGSDGDKTYYQVCKTPSGVTMDGDDGSWCVDSISGMTIPTPDVLPVTFSSLAENGSTLQAPAFIGTEASLFNLGYSGSYLTTSIPTEYNTLQSGSNKTDNVPVMWAAAASSAATGYAASYTVSDPILPWECDLTQWDCVYHTRELALGFKIPNNTNQVAFVPDATLDGIYLDGLSTERVIRVADGGAIDNSAVAQLIGYLQLNSQDTNFDIVAFDDVQSNDASKKTKYPSSDISYMFEGAPSAGVCFEGVCVQVPELTIVKLNPASSNSFTKHTWTVVDANGNPTTDSLHYYTYEVQTVANSSFNIKEGSTGTLHVFASEFGCADTAPENNNDFPCYNDMLKNFGPTLKLTPNNGTSTKTGFDFLNEAFGL